MSHIYDLIIIGSGPAGLAAAVYAQRAKLDTLVVEKAMVSGGQVLTTYEVDNYPGLPGISGYDLGIKFREHADRLGARFVEDEVLNIQDGGKGAIKGVVCQGNTYEARSLILATGAVHRKLGVPGEEELAGAGVSYCATCDGAFFRNKVTAVIGGGDVAVEDAIFLARMCSKVYLIHRRNELRAAKSLQENLLSLDNVEVIWDTVADSINGDGMVKSLSLTNVKNGQKRELDVQGVFIAVGIT
ncbi:NAD(P)/FAD-dependent oxidoreductase, partial [Enterocloster bolteae]